MEVYIETERLIISPLDFNHEQLMFEMDSDPAVHRYVGKKPVQTVEQIRDVIAAVRQQYIDNGIGRWAVTEKATGNFVGWTGFRLIKGPVNGRTDYLDFGYRFAQSAWGKGYATESGRAALMYGINELQLKNIIATTDVDNAGSRNVLQKLGFRYITTFPYDGELNWREPGEPTTWYEW